MDFYGKLVTVNIRTSPMDAIYYLGYMENWKGQKVFQVSVFRGELFDFWELYIP